MRIHIRIRSLVLCGPADGILRTTNLRTVL